MEHFIFLIHPVLLKTHIRANNKHCSNTALALFAIP